MMKSKSTREQAEAKQLVQSQRRRLASLLPVLIVTAGTLAYVNSFQGPFLFDDRGHIVLNERIHRLWPPWDHLAARRPVVNLSLAVNYAVSGLGVWSYHAFNLAVHILAALTLAGVVRRTLLRQRDQPHPTRSTRTTRRVQPGTPLKKSVKSVWHRPACALHADRHLAGQNANAGQPPSSPGTSSGATSVRARPLRQMDTPPYGGVESSRLAFVVAIIWVVHPLTTQSVSYIIQRGESLMGLFYLLTVYCVVRGVRSDRSRWWYVAAVASCGLGMASKAVMVTAPVVVLLFDRVFISGSFGETLRRRWGLYAGLAATWCILFACGIVQGVLFPQGPGTVGFAYKAVTSVEYALTQPGVILHYLKLALWPVHLCLDYDWPVAKTAGAIVLPAIVLVALIGVTVWSLIHRPSPNGHARSRSVTEPRGLTRSATEPRALARADARGQQRRILARDQIGFLGAWFFLILAPTSSFIPIKDPVFEHRMYLSLIAVIILVVIAANRLLLFLLQRSKPRLTLLQVVRTTLGVAVVVGLGARTLARNEDYMTRVIMWEDVIARCPGNARAYSNLGVALSDEGKLDEAIEACRKGVEVDPDFASGHFRLGQVLKKAGAIEESVAAFRLAIRLDSKHTDALYSLSNALFDLGRIEEAAEQYRATLRVDPGYVNARVNLANSIRSLGRPEEAIKEFRIALEKKPDFADARFNLGLTLAERGRLDEAVAQFRQTLRTDPNHAPAVRALANTLYAQGRVDEAIEQYRRALRIAPRDPRAHFNLGNALMNKSQIDEAIGEYREVVRLRPDFQPVHEALKAALAAKQRSQGS